MTDNPILTGWKQIADADCLKVSIRTVMRWSKLHKLPVYKKGGTVFAYVEELEAWSKKTKK